MNTSLPSGVNLSRLERLVCALIVWLTFLEAMSMMETPPSRECAVQTCFPSGERSMASGPLPTGTTVSFQASGPEPRSMIVILSEPILDVKI